MAMLAIVIKILFVPLLSPLFVGIIRKCKARLQNRIGANMFQPYRDLWKLAQKNEVVSRDASWIFLFAPYAVFATSITAAAIIPLPGLITPFTQLGDFIVLISILMFGTFFLALGGLDVGNAFGDIGASREMTLAAITEGALFFAFIPTTIIAESTNLFSMSGAGGVASGAGILALAISGVAFGIAALAENARYPFDNPSTHLELTMVHEAMIIEYSGKRLLLMEWASANKLLIFFMLAANIFLPWVDARIFQSADVAVVFPVFLLKLLFLAIVIAAIESTIPKLRYFRLPELLFTSFAVGLIGLVVALFHI